MCCPHLSDHINNFGPPVAMESCFQGVDLLLKLLDLGVLGLELLSSYVPFLIEVSLHKVLSVVLAPYILENLLPVIDGSLKLEDDLDLAESMLTGICS